MLSILALTSIAGGTCVACNATNSRYEKQIDILSGVLFISGLAMLGAMLPVWR